MNQQNKSRLWQPALCAMLMVTILLTAGAYQENGPDPTKQNTDRIEQLEKRVEILEKILFSTAKLDSKRAARQLSEAQSRLRNSRDLFTRGLITESQLQNDQFQVESAERELSLAATESRQQQMVSELEVLESKQRFEYATNQLEHTRKLARRGFVAPAELQRMEKALDEAKMELENAQTKLNAARDLDSLKK